MTTNITYSVGTVIRLKLFEPHEFFLIPPRFNNDIFVTKGDNDVATIQGSTSILTNRR